MGDFLALHKGEIAAILTALCWTFTSMAFESAGKRVGSLSVNLVRLIIGFFMLGCYNLITKDIFIPVHAGTHAWIWLSLSGFVGFVIGDLLLFKAFTVVGARISMLVMSLSPPLTALFGWLIIGETLSLPAAIGMIVTIWGIALVILGRSAKKGQFGFKYPIKGVLLAFGGAAGQGLGLVLSKLGMQEQDPFLSTQIRIIAGIAGFSLLFTLTKRWHQIVNAVKNRKAMIAIFAGAFFGPFLGVSLSLLAVRYTSTGIASTLNSLSPVMIIPFAMWIFKEKITIKEMIGAVIAVTGVSLFFIF
ncbi:DMT family transporter [Marinilabiliaceae bacterium ANBcel2]|nr:DMT family transporter [Marinilabiliaceae bacterium ANBcel2]